MDPPPSIEAEHHIASRRGCRNGGDDDDLRHKLQLRRNRSCFGTVGILVASIYSSGQSVNAKAIIRKIALFVPFQAFVLALVLMPFGHPAWLDELLKRLGAPR